MLNKVIETFRFHSKQLKPENFTTLNETLSEITMKDEDNNFLFVLELSDACIRLIAKQSNFPIGTYWEKFTDSVKRVASSKRAVGITLWKNDEELSLSKKIPNNFTEVQFNSKFIDVTKSVDIQDGLSKCFKLYELIKINLEYDLSRFEGKEKLKLIKTFERDISLREDAIAFHKPICIVCGINFELIYGNLGKLFIHIHHLERLADTGSRVVDFRRDLVPVCPNCHAMLHRGRVTPLQPSKLKEIMKRTKNGI